MKKKSVKVFGIIVFCLGLMACANQESSQDVSNNPSEVSTDAEESKTYTDSNEGNKADEEDPFLLEMIEINKAGWEAVETRDFDLAAAKFEEILSHEDKIVLSQTYLDDVDSIEKDFEERKKSDPSARKKMAALFTHSYDSFDYLVMDTYAGLSLIEYSQKGQIAAAEYANNLYKEKKDERLRTLKEMLYMDTVYTAYTHGRISDSFAKEESIQLIPQLEAAISLHANGTERLNRFWKKELARLHYYLEEFDTYLEIYYDGENVDELEPVEVVDNPEMTNLEFIMYGLRWNEEKEEYETFTLERYWGYAEEPCRKAVYCDIHGRYRQENYGTGYAGVVKTSFEYDDDGRLIKQHYECESRGGIANIVDIIDLTMTWYEYGVDGNDGNNPKLDAFVMDKERPLYRMDSQNHSETYTDGELTYVYDGEEVNYHSIYGEDYVE